MNTAEHEIRAALQDHGWSMTLAGGIASDASVWSTRIDDSFGASILGSGGR
jgi:hypothetical protein